MSSANRFFDRANLKWVSTWLGAAAVALSWILGDHGVPVTIWWFVLVVASGGVACALLGVEEIYNLLVIILLCAALLTMEYWMWILVPAF